MKRLMLCVCVLTQPFSGYINKSDPAWRRDIKEQREAGSYMDDNVFKSIANKHYSTSSLLKQIACDAFAEFERAPSLVVASCVIAVSLVFSPTRHWKRSRELLFKAQIYLALSSWS